MVSQPKRFLLNTAVGTLHDRRQLDERCNTDDIERRYRFVSDEADECRVHLAYRRDCNWCIQRHKPKVMPNPDEPPSEEAPA